MRHLLCPECGSHMLAADSITSAKECLDCHGRYPRLKAACEVCRKKVTHVSKSSGDWRAYCGTHAPADSSPIPPPRQATKTKGVRRATLGGGGKKTIRRGKHTGGPGP
jgi:hypothetical protein